MYFLNSRVLEFGMNYFDEFLPLWKMVSPQAGAKVVGLLIGPPVACSSCKTGGGKHHFVLVEGQVLSKDFEIYLAVSQEPFNVSGFPFEGFGVSKDFQLESKRWHPFGHGTEGLWIGVQQQCEWRWLGN